MWEMVEKDNLKTVIDAGKEKVYGYRAYHG